MSGAELAYRWVAHHSPLKTASGDALIIGSSSLAQLEETLSGIEKGAAERQGAGRHWRGLGGPEGRAAADPWLSSSPSAGEGVEDFWGLVVRDLACAIQSRQRVPKPRELCMLSTCT